MPAAPPAPQPNPPSNTGNLQGAANCACDYLTKPGDCEELKTPPPGYTMSGWVRVTFKGGGQMITVGNESAPGLKNHSCIKDFEFGHANGCECRVTIHDEQGSSFVSFMDNILKDMDDANAQNGTNMEVEYGWVTTNCDTGATINVRKSQKFYFMMRDINCNFAGGKFMYQITGTDITEVAWEGKVDKIYGGDGDLAIHLTEALTQLFTDSSVKPTVSSVKFLKRGRCDAGPTPVEFLRGDPKKGLKSKWETGQRTKLDAAKEWLKNNPTKDGKALKPSYNSEIDGGELIFWEDTKPQCGENIDWDSYSLGRYVVNGGQYSSVLEFNPKIKWNFSTMTNTGGGVSNGQPLANTSDGGHNPGLPDCPTLRRNAIPTAGSQTSVAPSPALVDTVGTRDAARLAQDDQARQMRAFSIFYQPIEAELVVLGDEKIVKPSLCLFRNIHIVFINPYFIFEPGPEDDLDEEVDCGDWLSRPACNPVLSNKAWLVRNITHRIQDGKFTTSFSVYLAAPGVELDDGTALGGGGSCGWTPGSGAMGA
jgi:hypothetical protein